MQPKGNRFSLVYMDRGAPSSDSIRFRNRLAAYFSEKLKSQYASRMALALEREAGMHDTHTPAWSPSVPDILKNGEIRDLLDAVTIIYKELLLIGKRSTADGWFKFVELAMREENLGYKLDSHGGVHYFVDQEFERNRASTLAILDLPRFLAVRAAFEDCFRHLDANPSDTKAAIRSIFEALEILVKQMVDTKNLNRYVVLNPLKNLCLETMNAEGLVAIEVASGLFSSLACWVDSIHFLRHGQDTPSPVSPSQELAIQIISTGSGYIRWVAQFAIRISSS